MRHWRLSICTPFRPALNERPPNVHRPFEKGLILNFIAESYVLRMSVLGISSYDIFSSRIFMRLGKRAKGRCPLQGAG